MELVGMESMKEERGLIFNVGCEKVCPIQVFLIEVLISSKHRAMTRIVQLKRFIDPLPD